MWSQAVLKNQSLIRPDFPNAHRLGGTLVFREDLGNIGNSTFARYLKLGLVPTPDKKVGPLNMWFEPTIAATVAALPTGRAREVAPRKETSIEEQAVA
jgi:hypothetical protein